MALFAGLIYGEEFQVLSGDKSHTPYGPLKETITLLNRNLQVNRLMIGVGKSQVNNGNRICL